MLSTGTEGCPGDWGGVGRAGGRWPHTLVLTVAWVITPPASKRILARYTESRWVPIMVSSEPLRWAETRFPGVHTVPRVPAIPSVSSSPARAVGGQGCPLTQGRGAHALTHSCSWGRWRIQWGQGGTGRARELGTPPRRSTGLPRLRPGHQQREPCIGLSHCPAWRHVSRGWGYSRTAGVPRGRPVLGTLLCHAGGRAGAYLGCPVRAHLEPLTITCQLLPAERWLPWSERWVPPPRGPNGGCRALTWGS